VAARVVAVVPARLPQEGGPPPVGGLARRAARETDPSAVACPITPVSATSPALNSNRTVKQPEGSPRRRPVCYLCGQILRVGLAHPCCREPCHHDGGDPFEVGDDEPARRSRENSWPIVSPLTNAPPRRRWPCKGAAALRVRCGPARRPGIARRVRRRRSDTPRRARRQWVLGRSSVRPPLNHVDSPDKFFGPLRGRRACGKIGCGRSPRSTQLSNESHAPPQRGSRSRRHRPAAARRRYAAIVDPAIGELYGCRLNACCVSTAVDVAAVAEQHPVRERGSASQAAGRTVHLLDLGRPLPAVVVEVEAEPADPLGDASAERISDAVLTVIAASLHNGESILVSRMWLSHRNTPCAEYPLPICVLGNLSSIGTERVHNPGFCQRDLRSS